MSSITTAVAVDYRLQQWAQLVKDCQNRPQDMTVEQWCDTKGMSHLQLSMQMTTMERKHLLSIYYYILNTSCFCGI